MCNVVKYLNFFPHVMGVPTKKERFTQSKLACYQFSFHINTWKVGLGFCLLGFV
jgi:hypothetical protein